MRVVFCLPGNSFSGRFLECWTDLVAWCLANNVMPILSRRQSCNIYYVRNMCLGADVMRGPNQKPYNGKLEYDFLTWIDSDVLFTPRQFQRLLSHDKDIVSGLYRMEGGQAFATVKEWDEAYFKQHGHFPFLTPADIAQPTDTGPAQSLSDTPHSSLRIPHLLEVAYTGMGFMLVKYGVFESMEYPWFRPIEKKIGNAVDFTMEDVAFCLTARGRGYKILIDPQVIVGHEKTVVL